MNTEMPERFDLASATPAAERAAALRAIIPDVFREDKIDFDALRAALGDAVNTGPERFGLSWPGKAECMRVIQQPSIGTLVPMPGESVDWDTTENLIVEGDNLEVMKLLQKAYYGKVKLIYLDPPYNTGNDFIYPDNFREGLQGYLRFSGQIDAQGYRLSANVETDGRFHSKWLNMIYPRLFLARNLLHVGGLIAVQTGDTELAHLRKVMDEIFGEENYINTISVKTKVAAGASGGGEDRRLKKNVEFILLYARSIDDAPGFAQCFTEEPLTQVIQDMTDAGQSWKYTSVLVDEGARQKVATTSDGSGGPIEIYLHEGVKRSTVADLCRSDSISAEEAYKRYLPQIFSDTNAQTSIRTRVIDATGPLANGQMYSVEYVPSSGRDKHRKVTHYYISNTVRRVIWLTDIAYTDADGEVIKKERTGTLWDDIKYNNLGKEGDTVFPNGKKPIELIARLIDLIDDPDCIVLDFFAGSGSTGHAVMAKNVADGGRRRFFLVQLPERTDGIEFSDIAELTRERVRRVCTKLAAEPAVLGAQRQDLGFRSYRLRASNFKVWSASAAIAGDIERQLQISIDHVADGATDGSMLTELLLKAGYSLTSPVENVEFAEVPGYAIADGALLICLSNELSIAAFEAMVERDPAMILVLDAGFGGNDELKVNALQTVRARNQQSGSDIALRVV